MENVLIAVGNKYNSKLIANLLSSKYNIILFKADMEIDQNIDLVIVDGIIMSVFKEDCIAFKNSTNPLFQPILLITPKKDVKLITSNIWRIIDDLITLPIQKAELIARIEVLLRTRRQSIQLKKAEENIWESEQHANALVRELQKADKNKSDFIGVLSHELRNPLAAISTGVQILDMTQDKTRTNRAMEIIKRQTMQLCKLVDDLLDLTRITQNKIKLKKEYIDLSQIVKNVAEDMRPEYEKKRVQLGVKLCSESIFMHADPVRIAQMTGNILYNSLKFTQKDGAVLLTMTIENGNAVIDIIDNGIGISPEVLPHLFEPFTQAENTLDRQNGGLGLGLSIVKGIVELHGGVVSASSGGLGMGSEFTMRLPLAELPPETKLTEKSTPA